MTSGTAKIASQNMYPDSVYADAISARAAELVVKYDGQTEKVDKALERAVTFRRRLEFVPALAWVLAAPALIALAVQLRTAFEVSLTPIAAGLIGFGIFLALYESLRLAFTSMLDRRHREVLALREASFRCFAIKK